MTQERTQYGDDAKGQVVWAACLRCGVKDRADAMDHRTNAGEDTTLPIGARYYVHPALQAIKCIEWKAERLRAEGKR